VLCTQQQQQQQKASLPASLLQTTYCNTHTNDLDEIPLGIPIGGEQRTWD